MKFLNKYLKYKQKYLELKGGEPMVQKEELFNIPDYIINKDEMICLVKQFSKQIISQFEHYFSRSDYKEYYKKMIIDLYINLKIKIICSQSENNSIPITIVTIGNTPYKIIRLIELFSDIKNINFIYLPFSGSFNKIKKDCTCDTMEYFLRELKKNPNITGNFPPDRDVNKSGCKIIKTHVQCKEYSLCHWTDCELFSERVIRADNKYMENYLVNPEKILSEQYDQKQIENFNNMIINSGLKKNIDDDNKIIFIDYLERGMGILSFLMTIDKYLKVNNTSIFALVNEDMKVLNEWVESPLINKKLILNKYNIDYIKVNVKEGINYNLLLHDEQTNDRCVKSYKKTNWASNYINYSSSNIVNCNITLLNMTLILLENNIIKL
jgi:hypothetical protein